MTVPDAVARFFEQYNESGRWYFDVCLESMTDFLDALVAEGLIVYRDQLEQVVWDPTQPMNVGFASEPVFRLRPAEGAA